MGHCHYKALFLTPSAGDSLCPALFPNTPDPFSCVLKSRLGCYINEGFSEVKDPSYIAKKNAAYIWSDLRDATDVSFPALTMTHNLLLIFNARGKIKITP